MTPWCQNTHLRVWSDNFAGLWLLFKRGSQGEEILSIKSGYSLRPELCDWISQQNQNNPQNCFKNVWHGPGFESWKNRGRKSRDTLSIDTVEQVKIDDIFLFTYIRYNLRFSIKKLKSRQFKICRLFIKRKFSEASKKRKNSNKK